MEENNNTNEKPVSAFGMLDADKTSNPTADSSNAGTENKTDAMNQPADNNEANTTAAAVYSRPTADNTTNTPADPPASYYTGSDSTYTSSNAYSYNNDTIVSAADTTSTGFGIASLVMGIISILSSCCCGLGIIFSILGIIFGCIQSKDAYGKKPGTAIAGIITSVIGIVFGIIAIIYYVAVGSYASTLSI